MLQGRLLYGRYSFRERELLMRRLRFLGYRFAWATLPAHTPVVLCPLTKTCYLNRAALPSAVTRALRDAATLAAADAADQVRLPRSQ